MADLAKLAERGKAGAGARARLLPGEKGRARRGQPRPARRCSLSMRAGGGRPRAGQGTAQAGMRDGQESLRGRACALAGRPGKRMPSTAGPAKRLRRTGNEPRGRWARGVPDGASSRWMARAAAGRRLQGTGDESAGPALAGAGRGPCPHPVPSCRHEWRSQAGSGAVQPAPARQVPARPWRLRGLGQKKGHLHRCRCRNLWWVTGDSNSEPID